MNLTMAKRDAKPFEMSKPGPASATSPSADAEGTFNGNWDKGLCSRTMGRALGLPSQRRYFPLSDWSPAGVDGTLEAKSFGHSSIPA